MRNIVFTAVLFLFFAGICQNAQAQNQITGSVRDAQNKSIGFANVLLLNAADSSLVRGQVVSEQGGYTFNNLPNGAFLLCFSMVGFEKTYAGPVQLDGQSLELPPVQLLENTATLNEVQVVAKRPFLEQKIDRTIVNVANSITSAGNTALEVLERSPGVQVNTNTKTISLAGKQGVLVMINGKISREPSDAIVQMLAGMSADNIDRIELIHTPPANFEAEGNAGIINIILKSVGDEGFNGGYSAKAGYGRGPKYGASAYFNYRKKKVNWYGNYGYDFDLNPQVFTNYRRVRQGNDLLETESIGDRPHTPTSVQNARLGVDIQVSPKTVVGVLGTFFDRNWYMESYNDITYSTNGVVTSRLRMPNTETNHNQSFAGNINLSHQISKQQTLNFDADFINYDINNPSLYSIEQVDGAGTVMPEYALRINKKTPIRVFVAKADYSNAISDAVKLESGAKLTVMRFTNDVRVDSMPAQQDWLNIPDLTALFRLNEEVLGAYSMVSIKAGEKTDVKAGLRYEYTRSNLGSVEQPNVVDRQYGSFFPSVFVTRKLSETQSLNLSYSRRITRPQIRRLAPWLVFSDPTTLEGGNPALQPSFTNALKLDYGFKSYHLGLSYSVEDSPMRFVPTVDKKTNRQINRHENLDNEKVLSASLSMPFHPAKWWEIQSSLYVNHTEINFALEGKPLQITALNYGLNATNSFTLPKKFSLEISGNYDSPGYWGVAYWKATGSLNVGVQKDFGEKWGKLRFNVTDLFLSSNWYGTTEQPEIELYVKSSYQVAERTFMLSWSNTFGNKKIKSSRDRQTGSAEEMRRI